MSLESFLRECEKKGREPISYKETTIGLDGSRRTVEYVNSGYARTTDLMERVLNRIGRNENTLSRFLGDEIFIETKDGYHYGRLASYGKEGFILEDHHFDKEMQDKMWFYNFLFGEERFVPAQGIISIGRIPEMMWVR